MDGGERDVTHHQVSARGKVYTRSRMHGRPWSSVRPEHAERNRERERCRHAGSEGKGREKGGERERAGEGGRGGGRESPRERKSEREREILPSTSMLTASRAAVWLAALARAAVQGFGFRVYGLRFTVYCLLVTGLDLGAGALNPAGRIPCNAALELGLGLGGFCENSIHVLQQGAHLDHTVKLLDHSPGTPVKVARPLAWNTC